ncbi:mechanosensitive ion channel family protein [Compostimonas suwonensis]|uniref:Small-conductance mechanosensitive channel n=1 Tax=Compostimonas suwonensis TaxID=1048394 RepID=A0A2M9C4M1_9MICO|nr:mechanosensitive ion channel domain-containing protein [Compostimonas suwonensis]PJJ65473.1 small-conductance mechanosensitive channel [Compostimonas suwonensis]
MFELRSWPSFAIACVAAIVISVVVTAVVAGVMRAVGRRREWPTSLASLARIPFRLLLLVVTLWIAVSTTLPVPAEWLDGISHVFLILAIVGGSWLVCGLALFVEDLGLARYRIDVPDNRVARRIRTQVLIIRRLTVVAVVVVALGAILLTFPGVEAVGTSVLASAGLLSVVAGLAAQSTLGNVFAGMQLAFSDAIRVDDVVIVESQWGRIEEITLTYVVVHIWDDRRMVLPSTYFTQKPFENWTRRSSELLGSVEFDLDWRVTPAQMREELARVLARTPLWDRRVSVLQVTDAVGGYVRVRILVTAVDAPTLFDLRCFVREEMVAWLHESSPQSVPRTRVQLVEQEKPLRPPRGAGTGPETDGLFTGSLDAEQRAAQFTSTIPVVDPDAARAPASAPDAEDVGDPASADAPGTTRPSDAP